MGMTPLRILLTLDAVGGVWQYATTLARALGEQGVNCRLAGFGPPPTQAQRETCAGIPHTELTWTEAPLDWLVRDEAALQPVAPTLLAMARAWQVDLLHLSLPSQAAGMPHGLPVVVTAHSCVPTWWRAMRGDALPAEWRWQQRLNRAGLARADEVLAPSAAHAATLRAVYGVLPAVRVVHNATDCIEPHQGEKDNMILAVGRWWDEAKNGATLDQAAEGTAWPVVLVGPLSGPDGSVVRFGHARTTGGRPADAVRALMARAAIFVAPSRYEPFGLAVLEAALHGAALVLADIPAFRELWNGAALFVSPMDVAAWRDAFARLVAAPALRHRLALRAHARARHFTPQRQADSIRAAYAAASTRHADRSAA